MSNPTGEEILRRGGTHILGLKQFQGPHVTHVINRHQNDDKPTEYIQRDDALA